MGLFSCPECTGSGVTSTSTFFPSFRRLGNDAFIQEKIFPSLCMIAATTLIVFISFISAISDIIVSQIKITIKVCNTEL